MSAACRHQKYDLPKTSLNDSILWESQLMLIQVHTLVWCFKVHTQMDGVDCQEVSLLESNHRCRQERSLAGLYVPSCHCRVGVGPRGGPVHRDDHQVISHIQTHPEACPRPSANVQRLKWALNQSRIVQFSHHTDRMNLQNNLFFHSDLTVIIMPLSRGFTADSR